jgi:hypothetical protein
MWKPNNVLTKDSNGDLQVHPKAYGLRAFHEGGQGRVQTAKISNPKKINLTHYVVRGDNDYFVTIINKEYGSKAPAAEVAIDIPGLEKPAAVLSLLSKTGDPLATTGVTLGGDTIANNRPWNGTWAPVPAAKKGRYTITVPATSAVVVRIPAR